MDADEAGVVAVLVTLALSGFGGAALRGDGAEADAMPVGRGRPAIAREAGARPDPPFRVWAVPGEVDLGVVRLSTARDAARTVVVYGTAGDDLRLRLRATVPGLAVRWRRGPAGDRYQVRVGVEPATAVAGPFRGALLVESDEPGVRPLRVPVRGLVVADSRP